MTGYEYKVVPAPSRGEKARGVRTGAERFAHALANLMNSLGRDGWEFQRADTLPCEERTGLTGRTTVYHSVLVFRRALGQGIAAPAEPPSAAIPLLSAEPAFGEPPRIVNHPEGPAPKLGPATGTATRADPGVAAE